MHGFKTNPGHTILISKENFYIYYYEMHFSSAFYKYGTGTVRF